MNYLIIILCVATALAVWIASIYNRLVHLRNVRKNALSNIDVALQKRFDLVPQLVETVRGYSLHESRTLEEVIKARAAGMAATSEEERFKAAGDLSKGLIQLRALVEGYPELKANVNFMHLQQQLVALEETLAATRRFFNMATRELNDCVQQFPGNIVASQTGFTTATMWEINPDEYQAVRQRPDFSFRN